MRNNRSRQNPGTQPWGFGDSFHPMAYRVGVPTPDVPAFTATGGEVSVAIEITSETEGLTFSVWVRDASTLDTLLLSTGLTAAQAATVASSAGDREVAVQAQSGDEYSAWSAWQAVTVTAATTIDGLAAWYVPQRLVDEGRLYFIAQDCNIIAHTGLDVDYKITGYDWHYRAPSWELINEPAWLSIDGLGVLHGTPVTDAETHVFTIRMTVAPEDYVDREFTIRVNNSLCMFVEPGGVYANSGLIDAPCSWEKAINTLAYGTGARTVYCRGGEYTDGVWDQWDIAGTRHRTFSERSFAQDDMVVIRNYPGETPVMKIPADFANGGYGPSGGTNAGLTMGGGWKVVDGLVLDGGDKAERGALVLNSPNIFAKRGTTRNYQCHEGANCTGVLTRRGPIVDTWESYDNFDRNTNDRGSGYLAYSTGGSSGWQETFLLDSIGYNTIAGVTSKSFYLKHAGPYGAVHWHGCVALDQSEGITFGGDRHTARHCIGHVTSLAGTAVSAFRSGATDPYTNSVSANRLGQLVDNCLGIISVSTSLGVYEIQGTYFQGSADYDCITRDSVFIDDADTITPAINSVWNEGVDPGENFNPKFYSNTIYAASDANIVRIDDAYYDGIDAVNAALSDGVQLNSHLANGSGTVTKRAAGRMWTYDMATKTLTSEAIAP